MSYIKHETQCFIVSSPDETLRIELEIRRAAEYFDELRGVSSSDETLCRMLDITAQTKVILEREIKMQK